MCKEHSPDFQNGVTDQDKQNCLDGGNHEQDGNFGNDVTAPAQVKKRFAFQNLPVADNFFSAHGKAHKECNDHAHEQIGRKVQVLAEDVSALEGIIGVVVTHNERQNE